MSDVIIFGAGLVGLVAAHEAVARGRKVLLIDQEGPQSAGGQAFWSLGGLFMVDTPEQRRMGIRDSYDLALADWMGAAQFDRPEDALPRQMAEAYIEFAAGEMRSWLRGLGMRWFGVVGWAERGGALATGHGNSVPRFHITWGTGTGVVAPVARWPESAEKSGHLTYGNRHKVTGLIVENGAVKGVAGEVLAEDSAPRGQSTSRAIISGFEHRAESVVLTTGGIGGNHDLVRRLARRAAWACAAQNGIGVPDYVDGQMQQVAEHAGAALINLDRMWHYTEGISNWDPIWPIHSIRILPGPSSIWLDGNCDRLEPPFLSPALIL